MKIALAVAVLALAACSAAGTNAGFTPAGAAPTARTRGRVTFRVRVPRKRRRRRVRVLRHGRPGYISVDTQAITIAVTGPTTQTVTIGLTSGSKDCTGGRAWIACSASLALAPCAIGAADCYTADVSTYDAYDAADNAIPYGANLLSTAQDAAFTVTPGTDNTVGLTLSGVPMQIVAVSANPWSTVSGGVMTAVGFGSLAFLAEALDADGNLIAGPGAPSFTVAVAGPLDASVTQPPTGSRRFSVSVPAAAVGSSSTAQLTLTATYADGVTDGCAQSGAICQATDEVVSAFPPITTFTLPNANSDPSGITAGPDGNMWFTEFGANRIGTITSDGSITEYPVPAGSCGYDCGLFDIALGPDGNLWFTEEFGTPFIGRMSTTGTLTEFSSDLSGYGNGITPGPDGNLWFTEGTANKVGTITTSGAISEYALPNNNSVPNSIAAGSDGALWFTECEGNRIGRITTGGAIGEYTLPNSGSFPFGIVAGSDGNLWFTERLGNRIGKITTNGSLTEYTLPNAGSEPDDIAAGPDGSLWFAENGGNRIGRITTAGTITELSLTAGSDPTGIAASASGLWFALQGANQIGTL